MDVFVRISLNLRYIYYNVKVYGISTQHPLTKVPHINLSYINSFAQTGVFVYSLYVILPIVGIVVTISPSLSLYRIVVFPAASRPTEGGEQETNHVKHFGKLCIKYFLLFSCEQSKHPKTIRELFTDLFYYHFNSFRILETS